MMLLAASLGACERSEPPCAVKIAASLPLSLESGERMLTAVRLALQNEPTEAGTCTVTLRTFDIADLTLHPPISAAREEAAAREAVADPTVVAYLGPPSTDLARASLAILNRAGMVQISPSATWPGLTLPGFGAGEPGMYYPTGRRHFFRTVTTDDIQAVVAADWVRSLGWKRVHVVDDSLAYGSGIAGLFEVAAQDRGITIVGRDSLVTGDAANSRVVRRVMQTNPDLVYFGGAAVTGGIDFLHALRTRLPDLAIMGPDALARGELELAAMEKEPWLFEGIYATTLAGADLTTTEGQDFHLHFKREYGYPPEDLLASTYEATRVLLRAIRKAPGVPPTRDAVLTELEELGEVEGVLGRWHFEKTGDISLRRMTGLRLQGLLWQKVALPEKP